MPSVGPLFLETKTFNTTVSVVNAGTLHVTGHLVLRGFDGATLAKADVPIKGTSSVSIKIADVLASTGATAQEGRVELYDDSIAGSALAGQLTISYQERARIHNIDEEMLMPGKTDSHALRGVAVGATAAPLFAVSNPGMLAEDVSISCFPEGQAAVQASLTIQAQRTAILRGCQVVSAAGVSPWAADPSISDTPHAYAVEITSNTPKGEVEAFGMAPRAFAGTAEWTAMNFFDPAEFDNPSTIFAGIPIGNSPLLWGTYSPHLALHNYGKIAQTVTIGLDATVDGTVNASTLRTLTLQPSESRSVDLPNVPASAALLNALTVTGSEKTGGIAAQLIVEDRSQDLRMQIIGKSDGDDTNMGLHPWMLTPSTDDVLLLYNETATPQKAFLAIGNGTSVWKKTLTIPPSATQAISIKNLLETRVVDDNGIPFTKGSEAAGAFIWSADKPRLLKGRLLQIDGVRSSVQSFQCAAYWTLCGATITGPNALSEGQGGNWIAGPQQCFNNLAANYCAGINMEYGGEVSSYYWSASGLTATSDSQSASFSATATTAGQDGVLVELSDFNGCSGSATQTVSVTGYPPAVVNSISPTIWNAGTNVPITITGTGFGNQPSITSNPAPGVTISNVSANLQGTTINATAVIAANAPNESVTLQIQPGYAGSNYTCNCQSGQSPDGTATAQVQAVTPTPQIMFNGSNISGTTQAIQAGQQIALSVRAPSCCTVESQEWSVNESSIVGGFNATDSSGSVAQLPGTNLGQYTIYFIHPGDTEQVSYTYTLDNGQQASAGVRFSIGGPQNFSVTNTVGGVTYPLAPVQVEQRAVDGPGGTVTGSYLAFGNGNVNDSANYGIVLDVTASQMPATDGAPGDAGTDAHFQWVQLIQTDQTSLIDQNGQQSCTPPITLPVLDAFYPTSASDAFSDSPADPLNPHTGTALGELAGNEGFTDYVMWDPMLPSGCSDASGQPCKSIPIPIGTVTWNWNGCSINTLNPQQGQGGTTFVLQCGRPSGGSSTFVAGSTYPTWNGVFAPNSETSADLQCAPIQ